MFFLYLNMIKPVWSTIKTFSGTSLKCPKQMKLNENLTADFDKSMSMLSLKKGDKQIGYEILERENNCIKGVDIEVTDNADRRRGLGSLLKALSVMIMKENNLKHVYIFALPEAVKFHYINGFRTANRSHEAAASCMKSLLKSNTPFDNLKTRAEALWLRISLKDQKAVDEADKLYDEFLKSVFEKGISLKDANFPSTLDMRLTSKNVSKNSSYYNNILNKFGIDYTI